MKSAPEPVPSMTTTTTTTTITTTITTAAARGQHELRGLAGMAVLAGLGLAVALTGCSRTASEPAPPASTASATPAPTPSATGAGAPSAGAPSMAGPAASAATGHLALAWDDPARWTRRPPSSAMRAAEYQVPRAPGDAEDGECTVITFGAGQGGTVDDNIQRWVKQFDGASPPKRSTRTTHGMNVTRVDVAGTYSGMRMPGAPPSAPHTGYALAGAIVEAPSGAWFFKVTGPAATVKAATKELEALVDSAHPAS